jgi:hypothetical protein
MAEEQFEQLKQTVRGVLSDGGFHSHQDLFGQVAMSMSSRPRWQDVARASHEVGVTSGYVLAKP